MDFPEGPETEMGNAVPNVLVTRGTANAATDALWAPVSTPPLSAHLSELRAQ